MRKLTFSIVVPFRRGLRDLSLVLEALDSRPAGSELIIVADEAEEDCRPIVMKHGGRVMATPRPLGPAAARNLAASAAIGDVLVFIDADVVVSRESFAQLDRLFTDPGLTAAFGSYDVSPASPGFFSQYKNLSHAYVHRESAGAATTFWAGFGAVRRLAFLRIGGFDERFRWPSVEDIDLGYRLTRAGHRVVLEPGLSACHLKRWTMASVVVTDVRDRGIPWTQLILRYGAYRGHLNVEAGQRWSTLVAFVALLAIWRGALTVTGLGVTVVCAAMLVLLNRGYYRFMWAQRGGWFTARVFAMHTLQHVYNGCSAAAGLALFVAARAKLRLPGSLDQTAWATVMNREPAGPGEGCATIAVSPHIGA